MVRSKTGGQTRSFLSGLVGLCVYGVSFTDEGRVFEVMSWAIVRPSRQTVLAISLPALCGRVCRGCICLNLRVPKRSGAAVRFATSIFRGILYTRNGNSVVAGLTNHRHPRKV